MVGSKRAPKKKASSKKTANGVPDHVEFSLQMMSRTWRWTLFNYTPQLEEVIQSLDTKYTVYQHEICPETGNPHLQGYCNFQNDKSGRQMKEMIPGGSFRKATAGDVCNYIYCSKPASRDPAFGDFLFESGKRPMTQKEKGQCNKERWAKTRQLAKEGKFEEVDDELFIRYKRTLEAIANENKPAAPGQSELLHEWYYGVPGNGKSTRAKDDHPGYFDKDLNKWWSGYNGEDVVVVDEFSPQQIHLTQLLKRWAGEWKFSAETKNGTIVIRPKKIIVTSNYHPNQIGRAHV